MNKRLLSLLLALLMLVSIVPTAAFAAVGDGELPVEAPAPEEDSSKLAGELPAAPVEAAANDPVADLAEGETDPYVYYDYTKTTPSAPSYQKPSGENSPSAAVDNNTGTWYHSAWNHNQEGAGPTDLTGDDENRYIQLTLEETTTIAALRYLARSKESSNGDYGNGVVKGYQVWVSTNDTVTEGSKEGFTKVAEGTWPASDNTVWQLAEFNAPVSAKHVRLYGTDTHVNGTSGSNQYISAAEIRLITEINRPTPDGNLCRPSDGVSVTATASDNEDGNPDSNTIDGNLGTRWSTNRDVATPYLDINLGARRQISSMTTYWCGDETTSAVSGYELFVSDNGTDWTSHASFDKSPLCERHASTDNPAPAIVDNFAPVTTRYVRIKAKGYRSEPADLYKCMSLWEVELYRDHQTVAENLARLPGVTAKASGRETDTFPPEKVFDGNTSTDNSRWSSQNASTDAWIILDLHRMATVSRIDLYWQRDNVISYRLEVSPDKQNWTSVHSTSTRITNLNESFTFEAIPNVRYVRVYCDSHDDREYGGRYVNISLWEVEVYGTAGDFIPSASSVLTELNPTAASFSIEDGKLVLAGADQVHEDFTVSIAANLEQVVGADGSVYTPLVDKVVKLDVTVTNKNDPSDTASTPANAPIQVTIPGDPANNAPGTNPKPAVIPEIMEWYSSTAQTDQKFTLTKDSRIIHRFGAEGNFDKVADEFTADLNDLFDLGMTTAKNHVHDKQDYASIAKEVKPGDIVIYNVLPTGTAASLGKTAGFDDETYRIEITDHVTIYATDATGAYWATRTLLQALKLSEAANKGLTVDQGTIRDYPEFKLRGFILDAARKPMSMSLLKDIAKNMAWYKLNDFHVHLNDNLIFMENYGVNADNYTDPEIYAKANDAYSAFRLESDIQEEPDAIAPLSAKDYHFSKDEFRQFTAECNQMGINIVPEIDVPAHAKAIVDAFPSLRLQNVWGGQWGYDHPANCHLDLTNKYDQSLAKVQEIFNEYLTGQNPVFSGEVVHFGADEYFGGGTPYRKFMRDMIAYIKENGHTPRLWGSISHRMIASDDPTLQFDNKELNKGVQMNVWNTGFSAPQDMYDKGFDLINVTDLPFYMVPNGNWINSNGNSGRGGYGDYLNLTEIYAKAPNNIGGTIIPASSSQMLGSAFAIWDDSMIDTASTGLDEVDVFDRFYDALPVMAVRQWGVENDTPARDLAALQADVEKLGVAPNTNPYHEVDETDHFAYDFTSDTDTNGGHQLTLHNATRDADRRLLVLNGGESYAETGLDKLGWGNQLSFQAFKSEADGAEQILFESDHVAADSAFAYNEYAIKALPGSDADHWRLGFSRELHDYEFPVDLPVGEWVELTLATAQQRTTLTVNASETVSPVGKLVSKPDSNTPFKGKTGITNSSFALPVARIGSKTNAFKGYIAAVTTGEAVEPPKAPSSLVEDGKYDIATSHYAAATDGNHNGEDTAAKAIDNNATSVWHTTWSFYCPEEDSWMQIQLDAETAVAGLRYLPRPTGTNGIIQTFDILVSDDGQTWKPAVTDGSFSGTSGWQSVTFPETQNTTYVRLLAKDTISDTPHRFASAAEVRLLRPIDLTSDGTTEVTLPESNYPLLDGVPQPEPVVIFDDVRLTKGRDYTVSTTGGTTTGSTATVVITGIGGYTGTVNGPTFTVGDEIIKKSLANATVTLADSYSIVNGEARATDLTVTLDGNKLLLGLDYTLSYADNTAVGTATVTVTGIGDYEGTTTATFTVTPEIVKKNLSNTAKTKVTLHQLTFPYNGAAITPDPVVTYDGETLVKDKDYTVSYARNNAVGKATVTVTGLAPYCEGSASTTFTIVDSSSLKDLSDVEKTKVTFTPAEYPYTGRPIVPTFTVRYDGVLLKEGTHYSVDPSNNVKGGTGVLVIRGLPDGGYVGPFVATFTITGGGTSTNSGGSSSGGSSSGGTTATSKLPDGASMTTRTDDSGAMTATVTYPNGAKVTADIPVTGPVTAVVTVPAGKDAVTVTVPTRETPTLGHIAVILHPDGTEEIVKTSMPNDSGVEVTLDASAVVQVVDNTRSFVDVPADSWAKDAITFVTSREIFNGTGNNTFSPSSDMSRAMVCTVLANLAGEDTTGGETWYEKAVAWAVENNVSDGTIPNAIITREQLAAMLYRYAGAPETEAPLPDRFRDLDDVSDWAEQAMAWAVENDLLRGRSSLDGLDLAPKATATRAEVASVFQRYVALLK